MHFLDQLLGNVPYTLPYNIQLTNSVVRPVIGSFVLRKSWRWAEWTLILFAIFSWLTLIFMSETYKPVLLSRRRAKRGIPDPPSPFSTPAVKLKFLLTVTLLRPVHMLITEPIIASFSVYIAFNFGVMYSFFAVFGAVFGEVYGFTVEQSGLVFLSICIGLILAVPTALLCDYFFYQKQYRLSLAEGRRGVVAPEHRLYAAMFGTVGIRESIVSYKISHAILIQNLHSDRAFLVRLDSPYGCALDRTRSLGDSFCMGQSLRLPFGRNVFSRYLRKFDLSVCSCCKRIAEICIWRYFPPFHTAE